MKILLTGASGFIGTNALNLLLEKGYEVMNLDKSPPLDDAHQRCWVEVDIMNGPALVEQFARFAPDALIHLAARTDCVESTTVDEGYPHNTVGAQNVIDAIKATPSVKRVIITSSQFVCGPGHVPKHDCDYAPVTVYGQSKVITEQLTRAAELNCCWTLVRPTNIWGPWHQRYVKEFWKIASKRLYVHPGGQPVVRCYGYVGNLVHYLERILESEPSRVHGRVFYLGEPPADIFRWANAFCVALGGRGARRVPRPVLRLMALAGDSISALTGRPFYITSSRFRSMVTDYVVPGKIEETTAALGPAPYTLEQGVEITARWFKSQANGSGAPGRPLQG